MGSSSSRWPHEDLLGFRPVFGNPRFAHRRTILILSDPLTWHYSSIDQFNPFQLLSFQSSTLHVQEGITGAMLEHGKSHWHCLPAWRNSMIEGNGQTCTNICTIFEEFQRHSTPFHPFQPFLFCCNTAMVTCHPLCDGLGWTLTPHRHTAKMLCLQARSQHMQGGILMAEFSSFP